MRLRDNHAPLEIDDAGLDRLAAGLDPAVCDIPTAIGFCMLVRRACLEATGPFDEDTFGRGYGEENDFCRRAAGRGFRHVATGSTFVRHHGGRSFGAEKAARVDSAVAAVERLHPGYRRLVAEFIRRDPLEPLRRALDEARLRRAGPDATLVVGDLPVRAAGPVVRLVPEHGRLFGLFRIEADAVAATPNLPAVDPSTPAEDLAALLVRLGVAGVDLRLTPPTGMARRLEQAARVAGLRVAQ